MLLPEQLNKLEDMAWSIKTAIAKYQAISWKSLQPTDDLHLLFEIRKTANELINEADNLEARWSIKKEKVI